MLKGTEFLRVQYFKISRIFLTFLEHFTYISREADNLEKFKINYLEFPQHEISKFQKILKGFGAIFLEIRTEIH